MSKFKVGDIIVYIPNPEWQFEVLETFKDQRYELKILAAPKHSIVDIGKSITSAPYIDANNRKLTKLERALK